MNVMIIRLAKKYGYSIDDITNQGMTWIYEFNYKNRIQLEVVSKVLRPYRVKLVYKDSAGQTVVSRYQFPKRNLSKLDRLIKDMRYNNYDVLTEMLPYKVYINEER